MSTNAWRPPQGGSLRPSECCVPVRGCVCMRPKPRPASCAPCAWYH